MKNKNKATKFPVARIKRIMQKDEEVGKVAQATPVVISKALELFLAMIVEEASNVTVDRGSKRVEAYHLKHAIETVDMLDFLKEIVEAVPDPSAGGTIDVEAEAAEGRAKKRGKGKGRGARDDDADTDKPAPKRRRRKAAAKDKEKDEEENENENENEEKELDEDREMDAEDEDDYDGRNGSGRGRGRGRRDRDEDDDDWEG